MTDLIARLQEAASAAIQNEARGLEYDPQRLRGVVLELEVTLGGNVVVGNAYIQRKGKQRREPAA